MGLREDRLQAARLQGVVERHVNGHTDQAGTAHLLREALGRAAPEGPELGEALAELAAVGASGQALVMATARYLPPTEVRNAEHIVRLLGLAGADERAAWEWREAHPGGGWRTPQAKAWDEP